MKTVCLCVLGYLTTYCRSAVCVDGSNVVPPRGVRPGALGKTLVGRLDSPALPSALTLLPENK